MTVPPVDPGKKARWRFGATLAISLSGFVGLLALAAWYGVHKDNLSWSGATGALGSAAIIACMSFGLIFPIVYFCAIRRSPAALESDRRVPEKDKL